MHDAAGVRLGHGVAGLNHVVHRVLDADDRAPLHFGEVVPFEVLHHHIRSAVLHSAHVDDARDVLVLDLHRRPRLTDEALRHLFVPGLVGVEEFDRDALVQLHVGRGDDHAHAALAEHAIDAVFSGQQRAGCQRQAFEVVFAHGQLIGRTDPPSPSSLNLQ